MSRIKVRNFILGTLIYSISPELLESLRSVLSSAVFFYKVYSIFEMYRAMIPSLLHSPMKISPTYTENMERIRIIGTRHNQGRDGSILYLLVVPSRNFFSLYTGAKQCVVLTSIRIPIQFRGLYQPRLFPPPLHPDLEAYLVQIKFKVLKTTHIFITKLS